MLHRGSLAGAPWERVAAKLGACPNPWASYVRYRAPGISERARWRTMRTGRRSLPTSRLEKVGKGARTSPGFLRLASLNVSLGSLSERPGLSCEVHCALPETPSLF